MNNTLEVFTVPPLQPGKILATLGAMQSSLSRTSQRIAQFILQHPQRTTTLTVAGLAQDARAGEASIVRFCRLLGYRGFQDFKRDLTIELARSDTMLDVDITPDDDVDAVSAKLQETVHSVLSQTRTLLDAQQVRHAVAALLKAATVYLFGVGSSGISAREMKHKLMRVGLRAVALQDNHEMAMQAALLGTGDVAIAISHSGASPETVKALRLAKQAGATTIALTHHLGTPLLEQADIALINGHHQGELQGDSLATRVAQAFVLDMIYSLLVQARPDQARANKLKTMAALKP
ncbi:MurR/RpiR family transcriptional regulator [Atlantibacter hermannii]|uniref:MurR/RpiR family transcriptional regulator n=1 Tax=Atlantibacter hermannii TaxID=565 RepID=UPI0028A28E94|nr:MurR/RpiR family transcriptional regulator [Atlantibacter hermannii]